MPLLVNSLSLLLSLSLRSQVQQREATGMELPFATMQTAVPGVVAALSAAQLAGIHASKLKGECHQQPAGNRLRQLQLPSAVTKAGSAA